MKRVIYLPDELNKNKHVLKEVYEGHGVYRHFTPSGYPVHQEWAIVRESDGFTIVTESYNSLDYEDMLDAIDSYKETGKYGLTCLQTHKGREHGYYNVHRGGNLKL